MSEYYYFLDSFTEFKSNLDFNFKAQYRFSEYFWWSSDLFKDGNSIIHSKIDHYYFLTFINLMVLLLSAFSFFPNKLYKYY